MISDIVYDKQLVNLVNDNIKKVSMWILTISGFLTFIAVLLIVPEVIDTLEPIHYKTMQMQQKHLLENLVMRSVSLE
jgi:cell division transport system permease protein